MASFKALSVSQPFAHMIANGRKTVELRNWNTSFRGEFFIHAPTRNRVKDCNALGIDEKTLVRGAIVGKAVLYGVKIYESGKEWLADSKLHFTSSEFAGKRYGFLLKNGKALASPIPCKGRPGFFNIQISQDNPKDEQIRADIFDEEYRTQWINHH